VLGDSVFNENMNGMASRRRREIIRRMKKYEFKSDILNEYGIKRGITVPPILPKNQSADVVLPERSLPASSELQPIISGKEPEKKIPSTDIKAIEIVTLFITVIDRIMKAETTIERIRILGLPYIVDR